MKILAVETSTKLGGVALLENNKVLFEQSSHEQKSHSELVHRYIDNGLRSLNWKIQDIDLFATTIGPGSFTGIRVSLNTVKTFSYVLKKPLVGVDSLTLLAHENINLLSQSEMCVSNQLVSMINAYKNMVYIASFKIINGQLELVKKPEVITVVKLDEYFDDSAFVFGDGYLTYNKFFPSTLLKKTLRTSDPLDYPTSRTLGRVTFEKFLSHKTLDWNLISPLYLRASEAEEGLKGIKYIPLK